MDFYTCLYIFKYLHLSIKLVGFVVNRVGEVCGESIIQMKNLITILLMLNCAWNFLLVPFMYFC